MAADGNGNDIDEKLRELTLQLLSTLAPAVDEFILKAGRACQENSGSDRDELIKAVAKPWYGLGNGLVALALAVAKARAEQSPQLRHGLETIFVRSVVDAMLGQIKLHGMADSIEASLTGNYEKMSTTSLTEARLKDKNWVDGGSTVN